MLKQLTLKNFVLVDALDIDFNTGLTTITGESGAGKSILLNALALLLGERANTDTIRPGTDKADVAAEFDISALQDLQAQLAEDELASDDDGECLLRRVISKQGRSRAFVNGVPVNTQYLRGLGEQLVDIQGQNEHLRLANRFTQLTLLDDHAGLQNDATKVRNTWQHWQATRQRMAELAEQQAATQDRKELLTYQLQELDELSIKAGEFEQLELEHKRLAQAQDTLATLNNAQTALENLDTLRQAGRQLAGIEDTHATLTSAQASLAAVLSLVDDTVRDIRHYEEQVVDDPAQLDIVQERLNVAQSLARKHRVDPLELHAHTAHLQSELDAMAADDSSLESLTAEVEKDTATYHKLALTLSKKRRKAAPKFAKLVSHYMQLLGISGGNFKIKFEDGQFEQGLDRVEFHVTTNPNFPPGPLNQIASGGEQTRIALAIQIVAAEKSALPCLILDEADVGVGGTTADTVGRILRDLGSHSQVICITHAPQVAALGNNHFRVVKKGDNTDIHALDEAHRVDELARMLAGADITEKTRDYAASLLAAASETH